MASVKVELNITVSCTCGRELNQVGKVGRDEIVVESCPTCRDEAKEIGYAKAKETSE